MDRHEQQRKVPDHTRDINPPPDAGAQVVKTILLIGVGGMGCQVADYMYATQLPHVEYCAINTYRQDLKHLSLPNKFAIGEGFTGDLGAGSDVGIGREEEERINAYFEKALSRQAGYQIELVYIVGTLSGGTATATIPALSRMCAEHDLTTVVVYAAPDCEPGDRVCSLARDAIGQIEKWATAIMPIGGDGLVQAFGNLPLQEYHERVDRLVASLLHAVVSIGKGSQKIDLDLNDVQMVLRAGGQMGRPVILASGEGRGPNRIEEAVRSVLHSPMLHSNAISGAGRMLVQFSFAKDLKHALTARGFSQLRGLLKQAAGEQVDIIFGGGPTGEITDDAVRLTIIACGFDGEITSLALFDQDVTSGKEDITNES